MADSSREKPPTPDRRREAVVVSPWSSQPGTPQSVPQDWSSSRGSFPEAAPPQEDQNVIMQQEIELWQSLLQASQAQLQVQRQTERSSMMKELEDASCVLVLCEAC